MSCPRTKKGHSDSTFDCIQPKPLPLWGMAVMNWTAVYPASVVFGKKRDDRCAVADFPIQ